ncbi:MAG: C39 family peptidase [Pseudomonadota bacterium]
MKGDGSGTPNAGENTRESSSESTSASTRVRTQRIVGDGTASAAALAATLPLASTTIAGTPETVDGGSLLTLPVAALHPGDLLLPSFASAQAADLQFCFRYAGKRLLTVPSQARDPATQVPTRAGESATPVATHLDYFEVREAQPAQPLELWVSNPRALIAPYLLTVSIRRAAAPSAEPFPAIAAPAIAAPAVAAVALRRTPQPLSQRLAPPALAPRICSPTSVAMALAALNQPVDWLGFVEQCRDEASGLYGIWPLNVHRAAQHGVLGAVEFFDRWEPVTALLAADCPVVASIRYDADALPGAPQRASAGHLVLVRAVDARSVLVNDPAGESLDAVPIRYPRAAFERAWFQSRGAAYYFLPPRQRTN